MLKCSKVTNLHEFTKKSFFYSCLEKFTVYRPLWKQQKISAKKVKDHIFSEVLKSSSLYLKVVLLLIWDSIHHYSILSSTPFCVYIAYMTLSLRVKLCTHLALRKTSLQKTYGSRGFLYCQMPSHRHL
jgi:hypothetical protein